MFPSQELGHIIHHCPNVCCFECHEYGHIVVDCLHQIPPSGMPAHHHRHDSNTRHCTRSTSRHHQQTDTETADQGCSPIPTDIIVTVITTPTEAIPGYIIETVDATIEVLCDAVTPVLIITTMNTTLKIILA